MIVVRHAEEAGRAARLIEQFLTLIERSALAQTLRDAIVELLDASDIPFGQFTSIAYDNTAATIGKLGGPAGKCLAYTGL